MKGVEVERRVGKERERRRGKERGSEKKSEHVGSGYRKSCEHRKGGGERVWAGGW